MSDSGDDPDSVLLAKYQRAGRVKPREKGGPSTDGEIRWTLGRYKGIPFIKAQAWEHGKDGIDRWIDTRLQITIRGGELYELIQLLHSCRDVMRGATGARVPAAPDAPRGRGKKLPLQRPRARPPSHEAPSDEDIKRLKRLDRGED